METVKQEVAGAQAGESQQPTGSKCRFCEAPLTHTLVDLGMSPLCESYISAENANKMEPFYPLHVFVCERCFLAQLHLHLVIDALGECRLDTPLSKDRQGTGDLPSLVVNRGPGLGTW